MQAKPRAQRLLEMQGDRKCKWMNPNGHKDKEEAGEKAGTAEYIRKQPMDGGPRTGKPAPHKCLDIHVDYTLHAALKCFFRLAQYS